MTKPRTDGRFALAPVRSRKGSNVEKHSLARMAGVVFVFCATTAIASPAQTFKTLLNFNKTNGANPLYMSLVQGFDGNLYGTTQTGGNSSPQCNGCGTVFKITTGGTLTTLHSFCAQAGCTDGFYPIAGLVQGTDGNFYGTTLAGGTKGGYGTVFRITSGGTLTTLHSFDSSDGAGPYGTLIQATDGDFYGTTERGGAGDGTVFKISQGGGLTTLHSFTGGTDGGFPYGGLVQATNGKFYGTTYNGGAFQNYGTVFEVTSGGTLTTLHSFNGTDGGASFAGLVQAADGKLYGTTSSGGVSGSGTVFEVTSGGTLTTLHSFNPNTEGIRPHAGLVQATDGSFYGTTREGGGGGAGTVFKVTSGGTLTTLHSFNTTDGEHPEGGLVQATNGTFYGTTFNGGADNDGTVFSLSVGLGPFVETNPASGKVGSKVTILGTNLTGATSVTFNGTASAFTVVSKSEIKTTVPTGATTGPVKVTTPNRTLKSNVVFRVRT